MAGLKQTPFEVLLVDDNPADAALFKLAFGEFAINLTLLSDGDEVLRYLELALRRQGGAIPSLVILDLNLPRRNGRQVLKDLKSHPQLKNIPIVVVSSSNSPRDVSDAYDLHANAYIVKPGELNAFLDLGKAIEHWMRTVTPPPPRNES